MTTHDIYVTAAYGLSVLALAGLSVTILADQRARKRELAELEAKGLRRRAERGDAS
ncbi:MAG: heme exporter protein CcmD [Rhizobiaceae bacterium]|nr:heme exporter protein CcmD [Rhizobiaceae bacterium]